MRRRQFLKQTALLSTPVKIPATIPHEEFIEETDQFWWNCFRAATNGHPLIRDDGVRARCIERCFLRELTDDAANRVLCAALAGHYSHDCIPKEKIRTTPSVKY